MLFTLPDTDTLYQALLRRDASFDGQAYVGVTSTGIFCRLTCPARKPLPENCRFFATPGDCVSAGFRACKRCHPIGTSAEADPMVIDLLTRLDAAPERRWTEEDVAALGYDTSSVRRTFRRNFGMTFIQMARQRRLKMGAKTLAEGGKVIEAQIDAGFDSPSAFRASFAALLGVAPNAMQDNALLRTDFIDTPLGTMIAVSDRHSLRMLEFPERKALGTQLRRIYADAKGSVGFGRFDPTDQAAEQIAGFFAGTRAEFTVPLAQSYGTPFQREVWNALRRIPAGHTRSYGALAAEIGKPTAMRAVAAANGANQIALIIPCHRVIGADGTLTGYAGGLWRKQKLIEIERQYR